MFQCLDSQHREKQNPMKKEISWKCWEDFCHFAETFGKM